MAEEADDHIEDVDDDLTPEPEGQDTQPAADGAADPVESLAKQMGWSPQDKFRGDPKEWRDAESFILASRDINRRLSSDVRELRQTTERMSRASATIVEREIARRRAELDDAFDAAVEAKDADGARRATAAKERLEHEARETRTEPEKPAATTAFEERNGAWLGKHKGATALAVAECERLARDGIRDPEAQLEIAEATVRQRFPDLFEAGQTEERPQRGPHRVNSQNSRASGTSGGKKTAKDLPAAAREAGARMVKRGWCGSLEEYATSFFEEQA